MMDRPITLGRDLRFKDYTKEIVVLRRPTIVHEANLRIQLDKRTKKEPLPSRFIRIPAKIVGELGIKATEDNAWDIIIVRNRK